MNRAEVSKQNEFYISKHRYYELKHFCLQYDEWKREIALMSYISSHSQEKVDASYGDPTYSTAERILALSKRIEIVESTAKDTNRELSKWLLKGVTEDKGYECLYSLYGIPCCKTTYYKTYRKFFYLLSRKLLLL